MYRKRKTPFWCAFIGMQLLILDGRTAYEAALQGIDLCLRQLVPSLFPFLFLSSFLLSGSQHDSSFLKAAGKLFSFPSGTEELLIPAFLGGYPVGAQSVYRLYSAGSLTKESAERLLAFCSNAGPSFIFGVLSFVFPNVRDIWYIWLVQVLSIISTAYLLRWKYYGENKEKLISNSSPGSLENAIHAMAKICGCVILFRIVISYLDKWFLNHQPELTRVVVSGITELSNGCSILGLIQDTGIRFLICSILLALGGICVLFQTIAVCPGFSMRYYLLGKLLQSAFACVFSAMIIFHIGYLIPLFMLIMTSMTFLRKKE